MLMTVVGGFFGLDHLWLRSPFSGFLKLIVNIVTLGLWYFYDILQVLGEKDLVMKNGLTAPFVGPLGIGAGMFKDSNPDGPTARSPLKFMGYMLLLWMPFGIDLFIAGDSNGAMVKFLLTLALIPFVLPYFIALIWGFVNIARSTFMPKSLFTEGTYRMFPVSWFMDPFGPCVLGPVDIPANSGECPPGGAGSVVGAIVSSAISKVPIVAAASTVAQAAATTASAAAGATSVAAKSASTAMEATANAYKNVVDGAIQPATKLAATGTGLSSGLVNATKLVQKGGGSNSGADIALLGLFTVILGGGTVIAANRMGLNSSLFNRQKQDADDTPPEP